MHKLRSQHTKILKKSLERVKAVIPEGINLEKVDIGCQHETRMGQKSSITRTWHYKGQGPQVIRPQPCESTYLYGAFVLILDTVWAWYCLMPMLMYEAAFTSHKQCCAKRSCLKLPPYLPKLNVMEQVWLYVKQHWLSNRYFNSYEMIIDTTCKAWLNFTEQLAVLQWLTVRHWAVF